MKILNLEEYPTNKITWKKEWVVSEYESPWGIIQKFRYANLADDTDVFHLFGARESEEQSLLWGRPNRNLDSMNGLDKDLLQELLGYNIQNSNDIIKEIVDVFKSCIHNKSVLKDCVFYCPECLKVGYHSIFHQIKLFNKCVYHQEILRSKCPNCSLQILYKVNRYYQTPKPFYCKCGYTFIGDTDYYSFMKKWPKASDFRIKSPELDFLLNLSSEQKNIINRIFYYRGLEENHIHNLLSCILSIVKKDNSLKNNINHYKEISCRNILSKNSQVKLRKGKIDPVRNVIFERNLKIIREMRFNEAICYSIEPDLYRNILKDFQSKIFIKKIPTIENIKRRTFIFANMKYSNYCPYSYVYITIRNSCRGSNQDWEVEKIKPTTSYQKFFPDHEKAILRDIFLKLKTLQDSDNRKYNIWDALEWIVNKVVMHIVYNYFLSLIGLLGGSPINEVLKMNLKLSTYCPFFIIIFPENEKGCFEFHWWVEKTEGFKELENNSEAFFSSSKNEQKHDKTNRQVSYIKFDFS